MANLNIDEFLGHTTRGKFDRANYLDNWKKRKPAIVDTFLHCRSPIVALWQHPWPRVVDRERDGVTTREVWSGTFNSWESEDVLRSQYRRDRDTGARDKPPVLCPLSLMIEHVYQLVLTGDLDWTDELFNFEGDDTDKSKVLHAGGLYNAFGSDKLTPEQLTQLRKVKISPKDAWQENMQAKCNYVFQVIDVADLGKGVQVAIQTTALGDCVKTVIGDAITAEGPHDGNPLKNPYCIRWEYREKETDIGKKYKAIRMVKIEATDEILELIQNQPPQDITGLIARGNITELRASMEGHYVGPVELPWDDFFSAAEAELEAEGEGTDEPEQEVLPPVTTKAAPKQAVVAAAKATTKAATAELDDMPLDVVERAAAKKAKPAIKPATVVTPEDDDTVECDECGNAMAATDQVCGHCGHDYGAPESVPEEPSPVPARAKRSAPTAATSTPAASVAAPKVGRRVSF